MQIEELAAALRGGPKFIYALPNFQNPSGVTLSLDRRRLLIQTADQHGVPILEDDPYGQLRYEGEHEPALVTLDAEYRGFGRTGYSGNVLYLSTFSKTLAPGLRLGWIIGPSDVVQKLVQAKQGADLHEPTAAANGLRGRTVGLSGPARQAPPRGLRRAPRRDVVGDGSLLPALGDLDASGRRSVHLGHPASPSGRRRRPSRRSCAKRRVCPWWPILRGRIRPEHLATGISRAARWTSSQRALPGSAGSSLGWRIDSGPNAQCREPKAQSLKPSPKAKPKAWRKLLMIRCARGSSS